MCTPFLRRQHLEVGIFSDVDQDQRPCETFALVCAEFACVLDPVPKGLRPDRLHVPESLFRFRASIPVSKGPLGVRCSSTM